MEHNRYRNICIYLVLAALVLLSIVAVSLAAVTASRGTTLDSAVTFFVDSGFNVQQLRCWADEAGQPDTYYVFLPGNAKTLRISGQGEFTVQLDGVPNERELDISQLTLSSPYPCRIYEDGRLRASGNLVFMQSAQIPALFLDTASGSMEYIHAVKGNAEQGTYQIWSEDPEQRQGGALAEFSGRGNTSWTGCEKKGYKLTLGEDRSLLGLETAQTYVLIANARCNYLSNTIAFWLENAMGIRYATKSVLVDLYLNGEYVGNYLFCEPIYVGENGIPINDLNQSNLADNPGQEIAELNRYTSESGDSKGVLWHNEPQSITGGYLLERDVPEYYADEVSGFVLSSGDHYVLKNPKYASREQVEYIQQYLQSAYDAISASDGRDPATGKHYTELLDAESFALKYVLEEFLAFNDAGRSSAYYYKDENGLLYAGPGWDFEGAFKGNAESVTYMNSTPYSTDWFEKLWRHDSFQALAIRIYNEKLLPAVEQLLREYMDILAEEISASAQMDTVRWGREDFGQSCAEIQNWIRKRCAFLSEMWNNADAYVTVKIQCQWQNNAYLYLKRGEQLTKEQLPQYLWNGYTFAGWADADSGELYAFDQAVQEDLTLQAVWTKAAVSPLTAVLEKTQQLLPELCFGLLFVIVTAIYFTRRRK